MTLHLYVDFTSFRVRLPVELRRRAGAGGTVFAVSVRAHRQFGDGGAGRRGRGCRPRRPRDALRSGRGWC